LTTDKINDDVSNKKMGYSISLEAIDKKILLIEHILQNIELKRKFVSVSGSGRIVEWNRLALMKYIQMYNEATELILAIVHLTAGMPARAPEL